MEPITIVAVLKGRAGNAKPVRDELLKVAAASRAEDGCLDYAVHESHACPEQFVLYETWKNESALAEHLASRHYLAYRKAVEKWIDSREVFRLNTLSK
ncbi:putative quinol monooxygenase [Paenibacillus glycinis]|uniref:putative quinol monooxygenase n=1 Tax=Paenibacillus glycinis TaxID=2697035 RepID=UPI002E2BC62E|nr:putative quinol monooxygenase [Paenibacillus glycinis]